MLHTAEAIPEIHSPVEAKTSLQSDGAVQAAARLQATRMNGRVSRISYTVVRGVLRALEFALVVATGMAAAAVYVPNADLWHSSKYFMALAGAGLLTLAAFELLGLYRQSSFGAASRAMPRVVLGWTAAIAVLMASAFFLKTSADFSRVWLAMWYMSGAVLLIAGRLGLSALTKRWAGQGPVLSPRHHLRHRGLRAKNSSQPSKGTRTRTFGSAASSMTDSATVHPRKSMATRISAISKT